MTYRFEDTIGGQLVAKFYEEMAELLEIPNSWLPESYHTASGYQTLASVDRKFHKLDTNEEVTDHQKRKLSKAELIEVYAAKAERGERLFDEV
jgi:hypothetical protein